MKSYGVTIQMKPLWQVFYWYLYNNTIYLCYFFLRSLGIRGELGHLLTWKISRAGEKYLDHPRQKRNLKHTLVN